MLELIQESITSYNLPLTVLLGLVLLYWLTAALGVVDFDTSMDLDLDLDLDGDADTNGDASSLSVFGGFLKFMNADRVPVMIVVSLLVVFLWMVALALNFYFNEPRSYGLAMAYLIPNFIGSTVATKIATIPLRSMFEKVGMQGETHEPVVGRTGVVKSATISDSYGQVEIPTGSSPLLVNARLGDGNEDPIPKGAAVLVFRHDKETNLYFVRPV